MNKETFFYDGVIVDHMRNGVGKSFYEDATLCYDGSWENDMYNGHGKYYETGLCVMTGLGKIICGMGLVNRTTKKERPVAKEYGQIIG